MNSFAFSPPLPPQNENENIINRQVQHPFGTQSLKKQTFNATFNCNVLSPPPANMKSTSNIFSPSHSSAFGSTVSSSMYNLDSREAARQAKFMNTQLKIEQVAFEKRKWAEEKEKKVLDNNQRRREYLNLLSKESHKLNSMYKINKEKKEIIEKTKQNEEIMSIQLSLEADSQCKRDMLSEKKRRKRESLLKNTKIRTLNKTMTMNMLTNEKKRRESLYKAKYNDFLDVTEYNHSLRKQKRESLMMRNRYAKEVKMIANEMNEKSKEEEHSLYQSKYENWKNLGEYNAQSKKKRRLSLFNSLNLYYKHEKVILNEIKKNEADIEVDHLKSKYENWKDVNEYKDMLIIKRRESLSFRLNQWRREKYEDNIRLKEEERIREEEAKLNDLVRQDIEDYNNREKQKRRDSLQYRLNKARSDRIFDEGQKAFDLEIKQMEENFKAQDREALQNYYKYEQEKRRESLAYRNQQASQHALMDQANRQQQLEEDRRNFDDSYQNWKNLNEYYNVEKQKRRESLVFRLNEAHRHHLYYLQEHQEKLRQIHYDLSCRREDWLALQEYKEKEKEKERLSLQLQLQSWREYKLRKMKEKENKLLLNERDRIYKEIDRDALLENEFLTKLNKIKDINSSLTF